jgi:hypothetical protein
MMVSGSPPIGGAAPPAQNPFAAFSPAPIGGAAPVIPPSGVTSATPPSPGPIDTWGPGGDPTANTPLLATPIGGSASQQPGAPTAQGGADYQPAMQTQGPDTSRFRKVRGAPGNMGGRAMPTPVTQSPLSVLPGWITGHGIPTGLA